MKTCIYCEKRQAKQQYDYAGQPTGMMCDDCWQTSGLNPNNHENLNAIEITDMATRIQTDYSTAKRLRQRYGGWIAIPNGNTNGVCYWYSHKFTRGQILQDLPGTIGVE